MPMACDVTSPDSRSLLPRQAPDANPVLLLHGQPQLLAAALLSESRDAVILCWPLASTTLQQVKPASYCADGQNLVKFENFTVFGR